MTSLKKQINSTIIKLKLVLSTSQVFKKLKIFYKYKQTKTFKKIFATFTSKKYTLINKIL